MRTYLMKYDEQIKGMVERGVGVLSEEEITGYTGNIHYIPHHEVLKHSSTTTPMRVVFFLLLHGSFIEQLLGEGSMYLERFTWGFVTISRESNWDGS